jgi:tol-pal system protein YbgF
MRSFCRSSRIATAAGVALALTAGMAWAQQGQPLPPVQGGPPTATAQQQKAPPPAAKSKQASPAAPSAQPKSSGEGGLARRVEELEQQIVDMQVVIGTLESLAKGGGGGSTASASPTFRASPQPSGGAYSSSDAARIDGLETQIRALTAQVEQLAGQMRSMDGRGSGGPVGPAVLSQGGPPQPSARFGTTTVTTGEQGGQQPTSASQLAPPDESPGGARQMYETAYNHLLQQDYGAAEAGFEDFLKRYPRDALSANAQYWLGESHFVRGQYKQSAAAFLKGYQTYGRSSKAPDSLLKLAMSLERLGQKDAACSSYAELSTKFPNAPTQIRNRALSERQRIGCA